MNTGESHGSGLTADDLALDEMDHWDDAPKSDGSRPLVHTHGPSEGRGLDCGERTVGGRLLGWCQPESPGASGG